MFAFLISEVDMVIVGSELLGAHYVADGELEELRETLNFLLFLSPSSPQRTGQPAILTGHVKTQCVEHMKRRQISGANGRHCDEMTTPNLLRSVAAAKGVQIRTATHRRHIFVLLKSSAKERGMNALM